MFGCCKLSGLRYINADDTVDEVRRDDAIESRHDVPDNQVCWKPETEVCMCDCHKDGAVCLC